MKKIFVYLLIIIFAQNASFATTFGTYRPEYEYGLFDGVKFNLGKKKKGEKIIKVRDDVEKKNEENKAKNKEEQDKKDDNEYQMYRFMLENTIPI